MTAHEALQASPLHKDGHMHTQQLIACRQDTVVRDPFYEEVPTFFNMSLKQLYSVKHPTAWVEFERGEISEEALVSRFFRDGRAFDSEGMKRMMVSVTPVLLKLECWYCCWHTMLSQELCPFRSTFPVLPCLADVTFPAWLTILLALKRQVGRLVHVQLEACEYMDGIQQLLEELLDEGIHMHAMSNYPVWYQDINAKLRIDRYAVCVVTRDSGCWSARRPCLPFSCNVGSQPQAVLLLLTTHVSAAQSYRGCPEALCATQDT